MPGFDHRLYRLHLAQERQRQADLGLSFTGIVFNPQKHPRGTGGTFIQTGDQGAATQGVQKKLGINADGQYGQMTKQAVEAYQREHGLQVDGVVGSQTAASLLGQGSQGVGSISAKQVAALAGHASAAMKSTTRAATKSTTKKSSTKKTYVSPAEAASITRYIGQGAG